MLLKTSATMLLGTLIASAAGTGHSLIGLPDPTTLLPAVPEPSVALPVALLAAGVWFFGKRLVASR